jgi:N-methylhydantoinase A
VVEHAKTRLAADIGGTFTDIVLDTPKGRLTSKVLTTPRAPEEAVINGTAAVLQRAGLDFSDIDVFVHGTTLATNAIIERKGARTALIATAGFRDSLEIADEGRFDQYDVFIERPKVLIPRSLRFTVPERVDVHGAVRLPLDSGAVRAVAQRIRDENVEAVAVVLMHGYANPAHEQQIAAILHEICPGVSVSLGSEVAPEAREYERTSTVAANAYVQPLMAGYLARLDKSFAAKGSTAPIHLITSGGSLASLDTAMRFPVRLVESGPAGGAILAAHIAAERGENAIFSFDMGGTTAKICLIDNGQPLKSRSFEVDRSARFMKGSGLPVRIPVIEMSRSGPAAGQLRASTRSNVYWSGRGVLVPSPDPPAMAVAELNRRLPMQMSCSAKSIQRALPEARSRSIPRSPAKSSQHASAPRSRSARLKQASALPRSSARTWPMRRVCTQSSAVPTLRAGP